MSNTKEAIVDPNMDESLVEITDRLNKLGVNDSDAAAEYPPLPLEEGMVAFCNNQITKKILREGTGEVPVPGSTVTVHYVGRLKSDGTIFDNSRDRDEPFSFTMGENQVIQGWDISIPTMKKGELAEITISPIYAYSDLGFDPSIPPHATLIFEVEMLSWQAGRKTIAPGVEKSFIVRGEGWEIPSVPSICNVSLEGRVGSESGPVYLRTAGFVQIDLDDPELPEGLESALCSMKPGEKSEFWVDYMVAGNGFLPETHVSNIHEGSNLYFTIEMESFTTQKQPWEMEMSEKIEAGTGLKESGNKFFKLGLWKRALDRYSSAFDMFEFDLADAKGDDMKAIAEIMIACQSNISAVKLKVGAYNDVIEACDKVLKVDPHHIKTLYRKAQAQVHLDMTEEAMNTLIFASDLPCPDILKKDLVRALNLVRVKYEKEVSADKAKWKKAFRK